MTADRPHTESIPMRSVGSLLHKAPPVPQSKILLGELGRALHTRGRHNGANLHMSHAKAKATVPCALNHSSTELLQRASGDHGTIESQNGFSLKGPVHLLPSSCHRLLAPPPIRAQDLIQLGHEHLQGWASTMASQRHSHNFIGQHVPGPHCSLRSPSPTPLSEHVPTHRKGSRRVMNICRGDSTNGVSTEALRGLSCLCTPHNNSYNPMHSGSRISMPAHTTCSSSSTRDHSRGSAKQR